MLNLRILAAPLCAFALLAAGGVAKAADQVVCTEDGGGVAYRLDFNWTKSTVDIAVKAGKGGWAVKYKNATAVRNAANDPAFLAEGTPKEFTGGSGGDCGAFVETWYFDVAGKDGKREGTVEKTPRWVTKGGSTATCKAKAAAPELQATSSHITCN